jgi:hypothetical protein
LSCSDLPAPSEFRGSGSSALLRAHAPRRHRRLHEETWGINMGRSRGASDGEGGRTRDHGEEEGSARHHRCNLYEIRKLKASLLDDLGIQGVVYIPHFCSEKVNSVPPRTTFTRNWYNSSARPAAGAGRCPLFAHVNLKFLRKTGRLVYTCRVQPRSSEARERPLDGPKRDCAVGGGRCGNGRAILHRGL